MIGVNEEELTTMNLKDLKINDNKLPTISEHASDVVSNREEKTHSAHHRK